MQALGQQSSKIMQKDEESRIYKTLQFAYGKSVDDFIWLEDKRLNDNAYYALSFIADSSSHGLNPNDYYYDRLQQLGPELSDRDAKQFKLLLTVGMLNLIHDITIGRLNPAIVDPAWSIPRPPFDVAAFLKKSLQKDYFKACLDALTPVSNQYRYMQDAVIRYQKYVDQGGWFKIPYSKTLRVGDSNPDVLLIRERLAVEDDASVLNEDRRANYFDKSLENAVRHFQHRYSLQVDGVVGNKTRHAMNVSATDRLQQIKINLERIRWLPDNLGRRYIMVNLANYRLTAIDNNQTQLDMRVIVGKKKRPTPSFSSKITRVVINPHWYVPDKLARLDLLPKQQANPNYFEHYKIRVFDKNNRRNNEISPRSVDWNAVNNQHFPYSLVQDPGVKNALGKVKFITPNPWNIYLHDTPAKSLFDKTNRNFSSGCIRVEDPTALANFSLAGNKKHQALIDLINNTRSYSTKLDQPLAVYTVYSTVWCHGDELIFSPDTYKRDQKMSKYL